MQPVQDLTVEDRVSRTEYQYSLEDPDQNELNTWTAKFVQKLQGLPELRDVATDQQTSGLAASLVIDRVTASRMGITPQMIDETLYDAFGQREISTLYTQLNQYHVILETLPEFQHNPDKLQDIYVRSATASTSSSSSGGSTSSATSSSALLRCDCRDEGARRRMQSRRHPTFPWCGANGGAVPLSAFTHFESITAPLAINHQGQFPVVTISFNLAPNASLGAATAAIEKAKNELGMPLSIQGCISRDSRIVSSFSCERTATDIGGPRDCLYCAGRTLRKLHSSDYHSCPRCLPPAWARF